MSPGDILQQVTRILQDPTSNLTAAVLLLAAMTLAVLIIIVALLLAMTRGVVQRPRAAGRRAAKRPADEYEYPELSAKVAPRLPGEAPSGSALARKWLSGRSGSWLIVGLVALGIVSGYAVSSTQDYCRDACHGGDPAMSDRSRAQHKTASCISCHEDGLPQGFAGALTQRGAHLVGQAIPGVRVYAAPVPSRRCLSCHGAIRTRVLETRGGARMSHREPLDAGMACRDCHGEVGHGPVVAVAGMSKCVRCHDSRTAPSECRSCHLTDTGHASAAAGGSRGFPKVQLGPVEDCGGCHSQASCDACHGMRMPHTAQFKRWQHARAGAFEGKQVCWRCHPQSDCSHCHVDFPGHAPGWKQEHKAAPRGSFCECHWGRVPPEAQSAKGFCGLCH